MKMFRLSAAAGAAVLLASIQQLSALGAQFDGPAPCEPNTCLTMHPALSVCSTDVSQLNQTRRLIHRSKLAQLPLRRSEILKIDSASIIEAPDASDGNPWPFSDKKKPDEQRAVPPKPAAPRSRTLENVAGSPILRTVMARVPAGPNSPFKVPAWLTVKRPSSTTSVDSATIVPGSAASPNGDPAPAQIASADPPAVPNTPQTAVAEDPDASGKPKVAQTDPGTAPGASDNPYPFAPSGAKRRGYSAPLDPVFPSTEWLGVGGTLPIGVPDTDQEYPLEKAIYKVIPQLKKHRIKIYGWGNPGMDYSSSHNSNIPNSYAIVPRKMELDQAIFRVERTPDTVQTEHMDWGFRATMLYGIDYRWTTAEGWYPASKQLLQHNYLYGLDPVELYGMVYVPKVFQGMVMKFGRYISPPDIEAQLAPDNFLWTHSQMFTVDCYTQTGLINAIKLNDNWTIQAAISAGADIAPWDKAAIPTGLFLARWVSKTNNDSIYGGINQFNNGRFRGARAVLSQQQMISSINGLIQQSAALNGGTPDTSVGNFTNFDGSTYQFNNLQPPAHDNLQQLNLTWEHRFNKKGTIVTMTEAYFLYQWNALVGGTVNNGPPHNYAGLTGPGSYINGIAPALGLVNYTAFKVTDKDYICLRPVDYLFDYKGERTGFPTTMTSWTIGWCHRFNNLICIRPEIRYDRALNYNNQTIVKPYDNGHRRYQFTFGLDCIARF